MSRLFFLLFLGFCCGNLVSAQKTKDISAKEFHEHKDERDDILLIDVRTSEEYNEGHIANALNIDFLSKDFKLNITQLDKNKAVYVYCRSGNRSGKSITVLKEAGFQEIYNLIGGFLDWKQSGYPYEKE